MKEGDKWINDGEIVEVVDWSEKNQRPEYRFKYSQSGYNVCGHSKFHRLSDLEVYLRKHDYLPYNPEPEIKVGDVFKSKLDGGTVVVKLYTNSIDNYYTEWVSTGNYHLSPAFPFKNINFLLKRLTELEFTKVVKEENMETKIEIKYTDAKPVELKPVIGKYYSSKISDISCAYGVYIATPQGLVNIKTGALGLTNTGFAYAASHNEIELFKGEIKITQ